MIPPLPPSVPLRRGDEAGVGSSVALPALPEGFGESWRRSLAPTDSTLAVITPKKPAFIVEQCVLRSIRVLATEQKAGMHVRNQPAFATCWSSSPRPFQRSLSGSRAVVWHRHRVPTGYLHAVRLAGRCCGDTQASARLDSPEILSRGIASGGPLSPPPLRLPTSQRRATARQRSRRDWPVLHIAPRRASNAWSARRSATRNRR